MLPVGRDQCVTSGDDMSLTISMIKAAKVGDVLRDAATPGLQLRVFEGRRSFYLYYRTRDGIQRKPKIGDWPAVTIDQARRLARSWAAEAVQGGDPSKTRQDGLKSPTVADLRDRYMERHGDKKKSAAFDGSMWRLYVLPRFGKRRVSEITGHDIEAMMKAMADTPTQANRVLSLLNKAFNLAIRWRWRADNPVKGVDRYKEVKRQRYLSADEYKRLAAAMTKAAETSPAAVAAIRLLILTGARLSEIVGARREWVVGDELRLPDSKTGKKIIHLSDAALAVIESVPDIDGYLVGLATRPTKVWNKILTAAGITDLRIHDLRHSFASEALAEGFTLDQIGEMLGHRSAQTTKRYAHLIDDMKKKAAAQMGGRMGQRMSST